MPHKPAEQTGWNYAQASPREGQPSYGDILIAREVLQQTKLHIIVRPRGGDFLYSSTEQRIMLKDIENARRLGADGVVFGCLTAEGDVDIPLMEQLMKASQGMSVTFHRAFDVCRNPQKAIEDIIALGCGCILTSGQQSTAEQGIPLLKELQQQASGRIILLAGCGVNEANIAHIARETGIREFHFSARKISRAPCSIIIPPSLWEERYILMNIHIPSLLRSG